MNIENIEAFAYVAHFGSFKKAAEALYLTQPSVTSRIQSLERELNVQLFDRESKRIKITKQGEQFLPHAQQILQSYQMMKQNSGTNETLTNQITIGCTPTISEYVIPKILPALKDKYANCSFKIVINSSEIILDKVLNKEVDVGFVRNVAHPKIDFHPYMEDPISLFVPPDHAFAKASVVTVDEIARQQLIFLNCRIMDWVAIHRFFEVQDKKPNIVFETNSIDMVKKLIVKGNGIGFLPIYYAQDDQRNNKLVRIDLPHFPNMYVPVNLISLRGMNVRLRNTLLELGLADKLQAYPYTKSS